MITKGWRVRRGAAVVAAGTLWLGTGCAADQSEPSTAADDTDSLPLSAELRRHRGDEGRRVIQVTMTNTGPEPLVVHKLTLEAPGFVSVAPTPKGSTVRPGIPVDLPIPYGTTDCAHPTGDTSEQEDDKPATHVRLRVGPADGPVQDVRLEVDPAPLDSLRVAECAQADLARAVSVRFGPNWTDGTRDGLPALDGTLVLTRGAAEGPVAVTALDGSTLLLMTIAAALPQLPFVLESDAGQAELAIQVSATSCDPHVRSQSQRPYELSIYVSVDGAEPLFVAPAVDEAARARMQHMIQATCK